MLVTTHELKFLPGRGAEGEYCFCAAALAGVGAEEDLGIVSEIIRYTVKASSADSLRRAGGSLTQCWRYLCLPASSSPSALAPY